MGYWSFRSLRTYVSLHAHMQFSGENAAHMCTRYFPFCDVSMPICEIALVIYSFCLSEVQVLSERHNDDHTR